jgi:hypothetical protein
VLETEPKITSVGFIGKDFVVAFDTIFGETYKLQSPFLLPDSSRPAAVMNIPGTGGDMQVLPTSALNQWQAFCSVKSEFQQAVFLRRAAN